MAGRLRHHRRIRCLFCRPENKPLLASHTGRRHTHSVLNVWFEMWPVECGAAILSDSPWEIVVTEPGAKNSPIIMPRLLLCLVALAAATTDALQLRGAGRAVVMQAGPAPAIAKPKTVTKQTTKSTTGGGGGGGGPAAQIAKPKRKAHTEDTPLWKVLLLGDESYNENPEIVYEVLKEVIPEIPNLRDAQQRFEEAQAIGKSILVSVPKEHGEMYVEQFARANSEMIVFADLEEEKN